VPFRGLTAASDEETDFRFVRFRPPPLEQRVTTCLRCPIFGLTVRYSS